MGISVKMTRSAGRGVFTDKPIRKGEVIEVCPVIPLNKYDWKKIDRTVLRYHAFTWPDEPYGTACIVLGLGSIINHNKNPNSEWVTNVKQRTVTFIALRDISKGEEITHDYQWDDSLWEE